MNQPVGSYWLQWLLQKCIAKLTFLHNQILILNLPLNASFSSSCFPIHSSLLQEILEQMQKGRGIYNVFSVSQERNTSENLFLQLHPSYWPLRINRLHGVMHTEICLCFMKLYSVYSTNVLFLRSYWLSKHAFSSCGEGLGKGPFSDTFPELFAPYSAVSALYYKHGRSQGEALRLKFCYQNPLLFTMHLIFLL